MKRLVPTQSLPAALGALLVLAVVSCGRDSVRVYHVDSSDSATPAPPPATTPAVMPATMPDGLAAPDHGGQPQLKYTVPAGWQEKAPTELRVASFGISQDGKQADVSVIPLGGMAGGDLANVSRWRGQVGLPPLADDDLQKLAEKVEVAGQPADLFDLAGTTPGGGDSQRILGVILHRADAVWFFKMTGDAKLVEDQKPAFVSFLKSLSFGTAAAAAPAMDLTQLPPQHPPIAGMDLTAPASSDASAKPAWTVPAGWQEGQLAQFLVAKYVIAGAGGASADVNVSSLAGDGGGLLPNVNRWRAQLGLDPAADADLGKTTSAFDAMAAPATLVDLSGTDPRTGKPARLLGVILPLNGQTWFYKLMGDADTVAQQKDAFTKFVQSAKYPSGQ
jgi:hypothetical protein